MICVEVCTSQRELNLVVTLPVWVLCSGGGMCGLVISEKQQLSQMIHSFHWFALVFCIIALYRNQDFHRICVPLTMYDLKIKRLVYSKCRLSHTFERNCAVNQMQEITIAKIANLFFFQKNFFLLEYSVTS